MRIWSWQHVSVIHCWVEPSILLSSFYLFFKSYRQRNTTQPLRTDNRPLSLTLFFFHIFTLSTWDQVHPRQTSDIHTKRDKIYLSAPKKMAAKVRKSWWQIFATNTSKSWKCNIIAHLLRKCDHCGCLIRFYAMIWSDPCIPGPIHGSRCLSLRDLVETWLMWLWLMKIPTQYQLIMLIGQS